MPERLGDAKRDSGTGGWLCRLRPYFGFPFPSQAHGWCERPQWQRHKQTPALWRPGSRPPLSNTRSRTPRRPAPSSSGGASPIAVSLAHWPGTDAAVATIASPARENRSRTSTVWCRPTPPRSLSSARSAASDLRCCGRRGACSSSTPPSRHTRRPGGPAISVHSVSAASPIPWQSGKSSLPWPHCSPRPFSGGTPWSVPPALFVGRPTLS
jgi:hypothetical protein